MKFRGKNRGGRTFRETPSDRPVFRYPEWLVLVLGVFFLTTLACSLPLFLSPPQPTPLPQLIWWTNTPDPEADPQGTPAPEDPGSPHTSQDIPPTITVPPGAVITSPHLYYVQAGDTLASLSVRFSVSPEEITSPQPIPESGFLDPNQLLIIPRRLYNTTSPQHLLPDSEVVYSPSAIDFDVEAFTQQAGGYLSTYREYLGSTGWTSGAEIVARVAIENSINPRLLLSLLEYQSGWVFGKPDNKTKTDYPMGHVEKDKDGLYSQLAWAVNQLSIGYYNWREGLLTDIRFQDGVSARLSPELNAGTVALQYFFAQLDDSSQWLAATNPETGLVALHESMFGSPWLRATQVEPLFPPQLAQPELILPFLIGQVWSFSGGPHGAWEKDGAMAALDFAPESSEPGCAKSDHWIVAAAPGEVVRVGKGIVVLDLDGDGHEQTGWDLVYLHILPLYRVQVGARVNKGDLLGNPSCEGGRATGTHLHFARKYNGEWFPAGGTIPFTMSGWVASAGDKPYAGSLTRDNVTIVANPYGTYETRIARTRETP